MVVQERVSVLTVKPDPRRRAIDPNQRPTFNHDQSIRTLNADLRRLLYALVRTQCYSSTRSVLPEPNVHPRVLAEHKPQEFSKLFRMRMVMYNLIGPKYMSKYRATKKQRHKSGKDCVQPPLRRI